MTLPFLKMCVCSLGFSGRNSGVDYNHNITPNNYGMAIPHNL